ncbi:MAG: ABC transporter substrate-binding protein, partial [Actinomycetota bacterium]|nr:ABC transporter substrate-binding protein [Actinomycetota bacterium]
MRRLLLPVSGLWLVACSASPADPGPAAGTLVIAVNAPFSVSPYIGQTIERGARLAVDRINRDGGVATTSGRYRLRLDTMDNRLSPRTALDNVRRAVERGVVAVVDEGTGVDASWEVAAGSDVPVGIVYQGGMGLVDVEERPNVFRVAPTDRGIAFRYAEYLVPKGLKVALLHDDTGYGQQGHQALTEAFGYTPEAVAADIQLPAAAGDLAPQVLEARRAGATALLVWARPQGVAEVIRAARGSGWDVPVYAPPSGQDPLVRQELADHPEWVEGLTFAAGRMTAEKGPEPFQAFYAAYVDAFGYDEVGVTTADGKRVVQPPDYAMYSYDFVLVLAAAVTAANAPAGPAVLDALNQVDVQGANGDERGFNEKNHEGVIDDDVYFAVFDDMVHRPVQDDPLSATLH